MEDRYTKLRRAIPAPKTRTGTVVCILLENWLANVDIPPKLLPAYGPQYVSKFFVDV